MMKPAKIESSHFDRSSNEFEVPEGWTIVPLGKCVDILDNLRVPVNNEERKSRQGSIPYYGATGQVGWIDDYLFDEELLLLGEDGAPFTDKSKPIAYIITGKSWVNNHAHVLRAIKELTSNSFLKHYLNSFDFSEYITGSTRDKLNQGAMKNIPLLLPPLAEQQRIVARVEALLTHVNAARERLGRVPVMMKKFRQGVLAAACEGRLTEGWRESNVVENAKQSLQKDDVDFNDETNTPFYIGSIPETWGWISIDDSMEKVIDYRGRTPPIEKDGIPHITTSNIRNGHINWITEKFVTQETYDNYMTRGIPEIGDVFFTMEGPLGEVAILHENRKFSLAQRMLLLRGLKEILDSEYLAFALMSPGVQSAINMKATGSGVKGVAYKRFKYVQLPHPPLAEQYEIVRRVRVLFARADAIEREVAAATKRCDALTQAVLGKAFRGELVEREGEFNSGVKA